MELNLLETDIVLQGSTSTSKHVDRVARQKAGLDTAVDGKSFKFSCNMTASCFEEGGAADRSS